MHYKCAEVCMHNIVFKKLTFSNFMSYGDTLNEVEFIDGLTYLNAANGYGKSTIIEALTFCLFGNSYRGGNIGDLKNTENKQSVMKTSLSFSADNGKETHEYYVERNLKPNAKSPVFKLYIDGVEQSKKAGLSQSSFEGEILGFDFKLFKYVIAMNSQVTTPFLEMPVPKKRELLEEVISVSTEKWKKLNNKALSDASMNFDTASKSVERILKDIDYTNNLITSLKNKKKTEVNDLVVQRDAKLSERPSIEARCSSASNAVKVAEANRDAVKAKVDDVNAATIELSRTYKDIEAYQTCLKTVDDIKVEEANLETAIAEYKQLQDTADAYNKPSLDETITLLTAEINRFNTEISTCTFTINSNNTEIARLDKIKAELTEQANEKTKLAELQKIGVPCPTCGKPSTEADVEKVRAAIEKEKDVLRKQWVSTNDRVKELKSLNLTNTETINSKTALVAAKTAEYNDVKAKIDEYNSFVSNTLNPVSFKCSDIMRRITSMKTMLSSYSDDPNVIINKVNELTTRKDLLINQTSNADAISEEYRNACNVVNNAVTEYNSILGELNYNDKEVSRLNDAIELAKQEENDESLQIAISKLAELENDLVGARSDSANYAEKIELCKYISYLCSDDGLKSYIIKLFVPYFNRAVEENLNRFNLPFHFVFDHSMDYKFSSSIGTAPTYDMLSQGQLRKVGFAISMAFCDFVFSIANFRINCMFLDEILDVSTDDTALRDMVGLVRSRTQTTPVIFAVTHRAKIIQDLFDYKLNINFNGLFSSIGSREKVS